MLEKYKIEHHDLEEKKKLLVNTLQENEVLDKMSEEVQLTKRRNQIADLHNTIQKQKDHQKLLQAKLKAYKKIKEMFSAEDFDKSKSDVIIRERIKLCKEEKRQLDAKMADSLEVKLKEKMYAFDDEY